MKTLLLLAFAASLPAAPPIRVMLLDGESAGTYHANWRRGWQRGSEGQQEEGLHTSIIVREFLDVVDHGDRDR